MSGYMGDMAEQQVTTGLDFLFEVAAMRCSQERSDATPCGKHRAQVLDGLRLWCQTSLPEAFRDPELFHPFGTISEQFLRDLFTGTSYLSEHCPSFQKLCLLPLSFKRSMVSIIRNPASGPTWMMLSGRDEARELSMTHDCGVFVNYRSTLAVLLRGDQPATEVSIATDVDVPASAS